MRRLVYIGIAVNIIAAGVILLLVVSESPPSDSGNSTSTKCTPVAPRSLLQGIHDKLVSGQTLCWKDGELSAEVVYFDDDGALILASRGDQHGVVYKSVVPDDELQVTERQSGEDGMGVLFARRPSTAPTQPTMKTSTVSASRARLRIVGQNTLEMEFKDVVCETEGEPVIVTIKDVKINTPLP